MKSSAKAFQNKRDILRAGPMVVAAAILLTTGQLAALADEAAAPPANPKLDTGSNRSSEPILPAPEDRQLANQFKALLADAEKVTGPGRDVVDNSRSADAAVFLEALESESPIAPRTLARARRYVRRTLSQFEKLKTLTVPAPSFIMARKGNLVMDGKLDEPAWRRAVEIPIQFERYEKWGGPKATVRLLWDSKFLYAGFEVSDANIIAPIMKRDESVWEYDCVELFLMSDRQTGTYWEIEISPTGSILDYLCSKKTNQWGSDFHTGETVQGLRIGRMVRGTANQAGDVDSGYTIEVAVPFDQLPGFEKGAAKNDQIHALLCRVNNDSGKANESTTSLAQLPYATWFHNIWAYQPFKLVTKIPKPDGSR